MSRAIRLSMESPVTVEQLLSAFGRRDYWLDRLAAFGGRISLDALIVDADGAVKVGTVQDLGHEMLPGLLARVIPGDLMIVRAETWRPVGHRQVTGTISMAAEGVPGSGRGTALLEPAGCGARLTVTATVEFKVPLVGGAAERVIAGQIVDGIAQIQRFTTGWIWNRTPTPYRHGSTP